MSWLTCYEPPGISSETQLCGKCDHVRLFYFSVICVFHHFFVSIMCGEMKIFKYCLADRGNTMRDIA